MSKIIVGSQDALISQLLWQIRNGWTKQESIEAWHNRHADLSDDIFHQLYTMSQEITLGCKIFNQVGEIKTIKECQEWAKHILGSHSETKMET